jgi:hypothetical protein
MQLATIIAFRDGNDSPSAELMLRNGERIRLVLDGGGLTLTLIRTANSPEVLFRSTPDVLSRLCAGLVASPNRIKATPLRILAAAIAQLGSAEDVRTAFERCAAELS